MLKAVDLDDKRGHLLVADTELHQARADAKALMYNELYSPFFKWIRFWTQAKDLCFNFLKLCEKVVRTTYCLIISNNTTPPCW